MKSSTKASPGSGEPSAQALRSAMPARAASASLTWSTPTGAAVSPSGTTATAALPPSQPSTSSKVTSHSIAAGGRLEEPAADVVPGLEPELVTERRELAERLPGLDLLATRGVHVERDVGVGVRREDGRGRGPRGQERRECPGTGATHRGDPDDRRGHHCPAAPTTAGGLLGAEVLRLRAGLVGQITGHGRSLRMTWTLHHAQEVGGSGRVISCAAPQDEQGPGEGGHRPHDVGALGGDRDHPLGGGADRERRRGRRAGSSGPTEPPMAPAIHEARDAPATTATTVTISSARRHAVSSEPEREPRGRRRGP